MSMKNPHHVLRSPERARSAFVLMYRAGAILCAAVILLALKPAHAQSSEWPDLDYICNCMGAYPPQCETWEPSPSFDPQTVCDHPPIDGSDSTGPTIITLCLADSCWTYSSRDSVNVTVVSREPDSLTVSGTTYVVTVGDSSTNHVTPLIVGTQGYDVDGLPLDLPKPDSIIINGEVFYIRALTSIGWRTGARTSKRTTDLDARVSGRVLTVTALRDQDVDITVYNMAGSMLARLARRQHITAGNHTFTLPRRASAQGALLVKVAGQQTSKVLLVQAFDRRQ
jgi:hypothetical protein